MTVFGYYVCSGPLSLGGCPGQSITGKDVHADREAARFLNPRHLVEGRFDDIGINLFQFLVRNRGDLESFCYAFFGITLSDCSFIALNFAIIKHWFSLLLTCGF